MRDLTIVIGTVAVLIVAWAESHHGDRGRFGLAPGIGSARSYCDAGDGFQPCAFVELNGAET